MKKFLTFTVLALVLIIAVSCNKQEISQSTRQKLSAGWQMQASILVEEDGETISLDSYTANGWHETTVPATVLGSLVNNGVYKEPYKGKNILKIPRKQFRKAWWYRNAFEVSTEKAVQTTLLSFDGINYRADIFLNGKQIAGKDSILGAFRRFKFDVSGKIKAGKNVLAVLVYPPRPGEFTIGFVDWNPTPPDNNMGLWRPVTLHFSGSLSVSNPFIITDIDKDTFDKASITLAMDVQNHTAKQVSGRVIIEFNGTKYVKEIDLQQGESKNITINADEYKGFMLKNPRLWWPNNLGEPNLYGLKIRLEAGNKFSDSDSVTFGVRHIEDYFNEEGHRGYKINGHKIQIKGGGWVDDLLLNDTPQSIETQIQYVKDMNLNTVRLEGFWGKDHTLYDLCDRYGILIMTGWSCHWEWEEYVGKKCDDFGGIETEEEMDLIAKSLDDQIIWFRNHPSIFVWVPGSDKLPRPALEQRYLKVFEKSDSTRPWLAAAATLKSEVSGPTGVKMNGPYAYTPPVYWYEDTKNGGAYGFNTETGPGPQVPVIESVKKMIPEDHLWPIDHVWEYHCGRNSFNTLARYETAITKRFGQAKNLEDFIQKAQLLNYELMRPMFEAFSINRYNATGIIQWMLNSSWPEMYWQLYDSYLMPTAAYYGAKKAAQPLHVVYNYKDKSIYAVNETLDEVYDLKANISLYDINSKKVFSEDVTFDILANKVKQIFAEELIKFDRLPQNGTSYFMDLRLLNSDREEIGNNFYWLAQKEDILDYKKTEWFITPAKQYADFTALSNLEKATVSLKKINKAAKKGHGEMEALLENNSPVIAFFIQLKAQNEAGENIVPVFWSDNYISLAPGESRTINLTYNSDRINADDIKLVMNGWNLK